MLRIFILIILFFTFSSISHGKVFDKKKCEEILKKCEEILKKYDVSYQSWNNILNRYLKERENLKDKDKKEINRMQNIFGNAMRVHEVRMNTFANSYEAFCK